ncbi:acyltransferase [Clostridium sp. NSJ-6]|uniref:Acyltransferase n=1 Tax=Clostridium hominis TaxID=2763036 RepID=A0ABR7DIJ2_9CLOT|nr:acyltransferase [Clostridium hominis]
MSNSIIKEINYVKGIAIILVFIGHAATPSFLDRPYNYEFLVQIIYSFHMSLFFFISGILSYKVLDMNLKENYLHFIKLKFFRLLVPFFTISFITNFIIIIFKQLLNDPLSIENLLNMFKTMLLYPENGVMGALWFLYTLFIIIAISPLITKLPIKIVLTASLLLNIFVPQYKNFLSFSRLSFFLVYFLIGLYFRKYYLDKKKINFKDMSTFKKFIVSILSIMLITFYSYIITNQINIPKYILSTLNFLCGIFGIILIFIIIEKIKNLRVLHILSYLGQYSMDIYLLSWFFQISSMVLISIILKISNYTIFFISNLLIGSLCIPFSKYFLRKFKIFRFLFFGEIDQPSLHQQPTSLNN